MVFRRILPVLLLCLLLVPAVAAEDVVHVVQPGETLFRISQRYATSIDVIAQANNISNTWTIYSGQSLTIPDMTEAVENPLIAGDPVEHVVLPGETLASIANRYGLTVTQLAQINNIANPNHIFRGQTLKVFSQPAATLLDAPAVVASEPQAESTEGIAYTVKPGEHLADIARQHNVSWPAIVQANNITDPNLIKAGETIIIPVANTISDLGILSPIEAPLIGPAATIAVGKQIIVDISDSRIYAYEDGKMVRSVLASTGLPRTPTVQGSFKVQRKYASQLMSGPGYYLPNVQWILYFYAGYAIHGTYWHNNFGQPMSHGCVNLPNEEALWFYEWAPVGTPVLVQA
jgi:LysM repeat protein